MIPPSGVLIGTLSIPSGLSQRSLSTLNIVVVSGIPADFSRQLGGLILDITLLDRNGNLVTKLDDPLSICLPRPPELARKDICLGFYDERQSRWKCEDPCLTNKDSKSLLCGQTDHLTNFALLLTGNLKGGDPCNPAVEKTLSWISVGFVAGAIILVILSGIAVEIWVRVRILKENRELQQLGEKATL